MVSITPEEVERAEMDILHQNLMKRREQMAGGGAPPPITLQTTGMTSAQIMAVRDQLIIEKMGLQDMVLAPIEHKTACPLCGKPSPENKTCVACLDLYIAEANKWIEDNVR